MDTLAIIKRIEARLAELGMSKADFYSSSGISSASFSQWRTGTYKPSSRKIEKAAEVLGVSADYLANGTPRNTMTSFANGICVFSGSFMADIEREISEKEPGTYWVAFRGPGIVITVDNDGGATDEQINGIVSIYAPKEKAPTEAGERDILDEVDIAFYGEFKELTEDDKATVRDMVRIMRERRAKKQE